MKQIFYFLDNSISNEDHIYFLDKLEILKKGYDLDYIIDTFYYKLGENNEGRINKSFFLEAFVFIDLCVKKLNINIEYINFIYKDNFLLFNEKLYIFKGMGLEEININDSSFVNLRYPWFNNPIFRILNSIGFEMHSINNNWDWPYKDKLYYISKIYKSDLNRYIGDILIPSINNIEENTFNILYSFLISNFKTRKLVIKKTFGEMGAGVKAIDLEKISYNEFVSIIENKFLNLNNVSDSFYIVDFYEIVNEFRIYYVYSDVNNKLDIFSVKNKKTDFNGVFDLESFQLYKGIKVEWNYIDKYKIISNSDLYNYIFELVKNFGLETGVLELGILNNGNYRFFEVNPFGGSLMFKEDQNDMIDFYFKIYSNNFNL